jgi:hypothetical protein
MLKDDDMSAAALYDGGWRSGDSESLMGEYDLTQEEADAICEKLKMWEPRKIEGAELERLTSPTAEKVYSDSDLVVQVKGGRYEVLINREICGTAETPEDLELLLLAYVGALSLQEIACRGESGIIIYEDSKEALVVNWSTHGPGELPRLFGTGVIPMAPEEPWHVTGKQRMEDARELLAGVDVIYDANGDLAGDGPIPATVYELNSSEPIDGPDIQYSSVTVIVPDGWN